LFCVKEANIDCITEMQQIQWVFLKPQPPRINFVDFIHELEMIVPSSGDGDQ
jgi:hypothetical protein